MRCSRIKPAVIAAACALAALSGSSAYATTGTITTLVNFDGTNGMSPVSTLIADSSGNLYGTTKLGGSSSDGTVFEVAAGTNALTTLATFTGTNGTAPYAGLVADSAGNLYGTTERGGANSDGTVFQVTAGNNTLSTLANFSSTTGQNPYAGLIIDSAGNVFGTTHAGPPGNFGSIFEVASGSQTITTLAALHNTAEVPDGGVIEDSAGNLFGTTTLSGGQDYGAIYEVPAGATQPSLLADFATATGRTPEGSLIADAAGNLYGTTYEGGASNDGNVFEYSPSTGTIKSLAVFTGANGFYPEASLIMDGAGNLFGTTAGITGGDGSVFEVAAGTDLLTTVAEFTGTNGNSPVAALYADASGNLWGTTIDGGANGDGTVFEITNSGFVPTAVPEPTSLSLVALGGLSLLRRRSRRVVGFQ